jgi:chromosome segregation ATPase
MTPGKTNTDIILGRLVGEMEGLRKVVDVEMKAIKDKIEDQNGSIDHVKDKVNGISNRINSLPCDERGKQLKRIIADLEQQGKDEAESLKEKRTWTGNMKVAIVSALVGGLFTVVGVIVAILMTGRP